MKLSSFALVALLGVGALLTVGISAAQATPIVCTNSITKATLPAPCTNSEDLFARVDDLETGPSSVVGSDGGAFGDMAATAFGTNKLFVNFDISATSTWIDTFDVIGGSGTGTIGFGWSIDGTLKITFVPPPAECCNDIGFSYSALTDAGPTVLASYSNASLPIETIPISSSGIFTLSFTYGVPFDFGFKLTGGTDGGIVDLAHTADLTTIILPAGATLVTGSRTDYPTVTAAVPEPATLVLTALGLPAMVRRHRRRSSRTAS